MRRYTYVALDSRGQESTGLVEATSMMTVFLAIVVGTIVVALFMPLISIISGLQEQS
jgi:type II secretory pathway component PulF